MEEQEHQRHVLKPSTHNPTTLILISFCYFIILMLRPFLLTSVTVYKLPSI